MLLLPLVVLKKGNPPVLSRRVAIDVLPVKSVPLFAAEFSLR
jgi:hypothetical protein